MPKPFSISLSMSALLSIRGDRSFKSSSRPARLILAVLGGFVLVGLWLFVITKAQSSAQAAQAFQPCNAGPALIARTHPSTGTSHNDVITAASDPLCIKTDLRVVKTLNTATPQVGEAITYTVTVTNGGPDDATGVQLTDVLPGSVTFGSVTPQDSCTETDGTVICDLGSLPNDATATVTIAVTPTEAGMITNMASVTGNESDPDPGNNTAEKSVRAVGADLVVTKTVNITAPDAGDVITYTITVANNGPDEATGVQVIDVLPKEVAFDGRYTATRGTYITATSLWSVGNLVNAARATMTIAASVISCTGHPTIPNTAGISADWPNDPNPGNNESRAVITPTSGVYCLYLPIIFKNYESCRYYSFTTPEGDWKEHYKDPDTEFGYVDGEYQMRAINSSRTHLAWPKGKYENYDISAKVRWLDNLSTGTKYGLTFGIADDLSSFYTFMVYPKTQDYEIRYYNKYDKNDDDGDGDPSWDTLCFGHSLAITTGLASNYLSVERLKGKISVAVNDTPLSSINATQISGKRHVGIGVGPYQQSHSGHIAEARFDDYGICPLHTTTTSFDAASITSVQGGSIPGG